MNLPLIVGSYLLLSNAQPVDTAFFENRVRPVLVEHCGKCHGIGEGAKVKGGLRLDSRQALLTGGDNGPAIVLGKPETSRLVTALEYLDSDLQMPPRGKLPANVIADMRAWISAGAPWPASDKTAPAHGGLAAFDLAERKARHWAWKPLKQPDLAPKNGAAPVAIETGARSLNVVLVRLSADPPRRLNNGIMVPFGETSLISRSLTNGWLIETFTLMLAMIAELG